MAFRYDVVGLDTAFKVIYQGPARSAGPALAEVRVTGWSGAGNEPSHLIGREPVWFLSQAIPRLIDLGSTLAAVTTKNGLNHWTAPLPNGDSAQVFKDVGGLQAYFSSDGGAHWSDPVSIPPPARSDSAWRAINEIHSVRVDRRVFVFFSSLGSLHVIGLTATGWSAPARQLQDVSIALVNAADSRSFATFTCASRSYVVWASEAPQGMLGFLSSNNVIRTQLHIRELTSTSDAVQLVDAPAPDLGTLATESICGAGHWITWSGRDLRRAWAGGSHGSTVATLYMTP